MELALDARASSLDWCRGSAVGTIFLKAERCGVAGPLLFHVQVRRTFGVASHNLQTDKAGGNASPAN
jgi:hypothetical protein